MSPPLSPDTVEAVFRWAEAAAFDLAPAGRQREVLEIAFAAARTRERSFSVCIQFPLLVFGLFRGPADLAVPLAGVTTLYYMGVDLFDDVADGDLSEVWNGVRAGEVDLAAAALFFSLPLLAVKRLETPETVKRGMQETLASGFLAMASGQHTDLYRAGAETVAPGEIEASARAKSGEELATFARLAALLAGASGDRVERCASMGRAYGTALQLASDVADLYAAGWSRDLAAGTRTLPIALYLRSLDGPGRREFAELLRRARADRRAQEAVRTRLAEGGVLQRMVLITEMYRGEALMHLERAGPAGPIADGLRGLIKKDSFVPPASG